MTCTNQITSGPVRVGQNSENSYSNSPTAWRSTVGPPHQWRTTRGVASAHTLEGGVPLSQGLSRAVRGRPSPQQWSVAPARRRPARPHRWRVRLCFPATAHTVNVWARCLCRGAGDWIKAPSRLRRQSRTASWQPPLVVCDLRPPLLVLCDGWPPPPWRCVLAAGVEPPRAGNWGASPPTAQLGAPLPLPRMDVGSPPLGTRARNAVPST